MEDMIEKERLVNQYLEQGNKDAAIKLLFDFVLACAKQGRFEAAEAMRSRIFEIDSMALDEIIRSGEIIEEEKRQAIDSEHRRIWAKLYDSLSVEEANALYFAFKKAAYQAGEIIFKQGEWKPRLYFIDGGQAKIVYFQDDTEVYLKPVRTGQFSGEEAFFSPSICTTTMIAQSRIAAYYLDSDILGVWKTTSPVLESKLQSFVSGAEKISDLLKAKEKDRRRQRRITLGGRAEALLMDSSNNPAVRPFSMDLADISRGGACFVVGIRKRETAALLLGKRLWISYLHPLMGSSQSINQSGTVVGVHFHPFEDCTVNVKFDVPLPRELEVQLEKLSLQALQDVDI